VVFGTNLALQEFRFWFIVVYDASVIVAFAFIFRELLFMAFSVELGFSKLMAVYFGGGLVLFGAAPLRPVIPLLTRKTRAFFFTPVISTFRVIHLCRRVVTTDGKTRSVVFEFLLTTCIDQFGRNTNVVWKPTKRIPRFIHRT